MEHIKETEARILRETLNNCRNRCAELEDENAALKAQLTEQSKQSDKLTLTQILSIMDDLKGMDVMWERLEDGTTIPSIDAYLYAATMLGIPWTVQINETSRSNDEGYQAIAKVTINGNELQGCGECWASEGLPLVQMHAIAQTRALRRVFRYALGPFFRLGDYPGIPDIDDHVGRVAPSPAVIDASEKRARAQLMAAVRMMEKQHPGLTRMHRLAHATNLIGRDITTFAQLSLSELAYVVASLMTLNLSTSEKTDF